MAGQGQLAHRRLVVRTFCLPSQHGRKMEITSYFQTLEQRISLRIVGAITPEPEYDWVVSEIRNIIPALGQTDEDRLAARRINERLIACVELK